MITGTEISRFDQNKLYATYQAWPRLFKDTFDSFEVPSWITEEKFESVAFCGMGGSATSSDILQQIMNVYGIIPAVTLRGESLPRFLDARSLVIVNSASGNTAESLMMMEKAFSRKARIISISAGGKLKELANRLRVYHIDIPDLSLPRASLPYLLIPGLLIIERFMSRPLREEIGQIPEVLSAILKKIMIEEPQERNPAKKIASFLSGGFPFCYSSPSLFPSATRFSNSMNENAKMHCITGSILEASHNDIVPFTFDHTPQVPKIVHLRWANDEPIVAGRFEKVRSLFEKVVQSVMEISIPEKSLLHSLLSAIYILDLSTIYIAISKDIDPSPTPAINILKDF